MLSIASLKKQQLYWILQIGGWSLYNSYFYYDEISTAGWAYFFLQVLYDTAVAVLVTHLYSLYLKRFRLNYLSFPKVAISGITGIVILGIVFSISGTLFYYSFDLTTSDEYWGLLNYFEYFMYNALTSAPWFLCYHLFKYAEALDELHREKQYTEMQLKLLQLENLQQQLNPHFLFNALNSIKALTFLQVETAREAINRLSGILRRILTLDKVSKITLAKELELVTEYLEIEKIRFEERLSYDFDLKENTLDLKIPPMIIQTLIENAVKHGINKNEGNGTISISSNVANGHLQISVINSGHFNPGESSGIGLHNLQKALELNYSDKASFLIKNENNQVAALVYLPLEN